jgi:MFS family permease
LLAVVGFSSQLPSLLFMPFAGVVADRLNRHRVVIITQIAAMLQAGLLAYLTLTGHVQVWSLIALGAMLGVINAFDMPVRSAFVIDMVKKKSDLPAVIAMNASLFNVSRLLGPAVAGFVVAAFGEGICFLINAVSYVAVIVALLFVQGDFSVKRQDKPASVLAELKDGLTYTWNTAPIRAAILLLATFGFGGMAFLVLLPVFVKDIGGNANTLGWLSSASALGSVIGTAILAMRRSVVGMGRWALISSCVYTVLMLLFGLVHSFWLAVPLMVGLGAAMMLQMGCCSTIVQSVVDHDKRGRVMSLFNMAFLGTVPLGGLLAGALANHFGFSNMIFASTVYCALVILLFGSQVPKLRKETRPIYIERGLIQAEEELDIISKPGA